MSDVRAVICHHTATLNRTADMPSLDVLIKGRPDLASGISDGLPLCCIPRRTEPIAQPGSGSGPSGCPGSPGAVAIKWDTPGYTWARHQSTVSLAPTSNGVGDWPRSASLRLESSTNGPVNW